MALKRVKRNPEDGADGVYSRMEARKREGKRLAEANRAHIEKMVREGHMGASVPTRNMIRALKLFPWQNDVGDWQRLFEAEMAVRYQSKLKRMGGEVAREYVRRYGHPTNEAKHRRNPATSGWSDSAWVLARKDGRVYCRRGSQNLWVDSPVWSNAVRGADVPWHYATNASAKRAANKLAGKFLGETIMIMTWREYCDRKAGAGFGIDWHAKTRTNPGRAPAADKTAARELALYIQNDGQLYRTRAQAIIKNLQRKLKRGTYSAQQATKAWMYLADAGAVKYTKEFGTPGQRVMFDVPTRWEAAKQLQSYYDEQVRSS